VKWLATGDGLKFGSSGTILSASNFKAAKVPAGAPCSLEIWFEPGLTADWGGYFAFYPPGNARRLSLQQSDSDLVLQCDGPVGRRRTQPSRLYVRDIIRRGNPLFVTVTSQGGRVSVYADGALAETASGFPLASQDFDGQLVVNGLPEVYGTLTGILRGLAFYDHDLSPAQVVHHYATWTQKGRPDISENERAIALYLFNERTGSVLHNQVPSGPDLYIPNRFHVVDQVFLEPFWKEFSPGWGYWKNVWINIAGFVPLGFVFCAYFSLARHLKRPALVTILLGFAVSFTIETLQSFLPTRDSGTTDLITNTLGTCLGVWLYRSRVWGVLWARFWTYLVGDAD